MVSGLRTDFSGYSKPALEVTGGERFVRSWPSVATLSGLATTPPDCRLGPLLR